MKIQVLNRSTLVKDSDVQTWTTACAMQLTDDVAPAHEKTAPTVTFLAGGQKADADAFQAVLLDHADQAGALGYHDLDPDGRPYEKIFVKDTLDAGCNVSTTLSHEMCEMFLDPLCTLWANAKDGGIDAYELCDAVEADEYSKSVGGVHVPVSNFLLPAYFAPSNPHSVPTDFLGLLHGAVSPALRPGGYRIYASMGQANQAFGRTVHAEFHVDYPEAQRAAKQHPAARTARRLAAP
jgi:hypothetical protein